VIDFYECLCSDGWDGENFDYNVDECGSSPCNGPHVNYPHGYCEDQEDFSYKCFCYPGYTGLNCETDIDECASKPCKHLKAMHRPELVCTESAGLVPPQR